MTLQQHIDAKLTKIAWCRVGQAAAEISRECHAGYWLEATENTEIFINSRRGEVIRQLQAIAAALDLTIAPASPHASNAALSGLHSIPEDDE